MCASVSPSSMKIVVFLELGADVRVAPERDPRSGRVREEWLVRETDPGSARALDLALDLKSARSGAEITAVHFGSPSAEPWLRQVLARGCDRVVRVCDAEVTEIHAGGKAVILAAAAEALGFDLCLAGAVGVINGSGQLGVLLAAHLGLPCVTQAVAIAHLEETGSRATTMRAPGPNGSLGAVVCAPGHTTSLEITRALDGGFRERVEVHLPAVTTVAAGVPGTEAAVPATISAAALLAAQQADIPAWDLADLGVPRERVRQADQPLCYCRPRSPRPRLRRLNAPDCSLPAFERILELVRGSVQTRQARIVQEPAAAIVDEIFSTLRDEGWLDHLRSRANGGMVVGQASGNGVVDDVPAEGAGAPGREAGDRP
ncbi:MAG: hypothetical protein M1274_13185 [Actinobacteria bacterium]|nr:hypothetical protein [Actinomycetota bacterium]